MSYYKLIILCNPSSRSITSIPDTPFHTQAALTSNTIQFCLLELYLNRITDHVLFWSGFLCSTLYLLLMCVGVIFFIHFCITFYCENIAHILCPFSHWCTYGCFHVFGSLNCPFLDMSVIHVHISDGYVPTSGIAEAQGICLFSFSRYFQIVSQNVLSIHTPPAVFESSACSILSKHLMFSVFFFSL